MGVVAYVNQFHGIVGEVLGVDDEHTVVGNSVEGIAASHIQDAVFLVYSLGCLAYSHFCHYAKVVGVELYYISAVCSDIDISITLSHITGLSEVIAESPTRLLYSSLVEFCHIA